MKKIHLLIILVFVSTFCFSQMPSTADFISDLEYFRNTLPQKHTNLFKKISKTEFKNSVDKIALKAEQLNYETFTAELFKLVVSIGDEHTRIEPTYTKILPIKFEIYKEGIFTIGVDSNELGLLPAKLIAINNHPIEEISVVAGLSYRMKIILISKCISYTF